MEFSFNMVYQHWMLAPIIVTLIFLGVGFSTEKKNPKILANIVGLLICFWISLLMFQCFDGSICK